MDFLCFFCDFLACGDLDGVRHEEIPLVILQFWWPQSKHIRKIHWFSSFLASSSRVTMRKSQDSMENPLIFHGFQWFPMNFHDIHWSPNGSGKKFLGNHKKNIKKSKKNHKFMGILWIFLCFFCDFLASGDLVCLDGVGNKEIPLVILQFWWPPK